MKRILDLVLGRPRVALSPSRLLAGEVTTPYGNLPGEEVVDAAWRSHAGDRDCPPWLILGRHDAPSGSIWRLAWCPPSNKVPDRSEIVLPEAIWALERLNDVAGPEGWHLRSLESPCGYWIGLWEGSRCEHFQAPGRDRREALEFERALAARRAAPNPPELLGEWAAPTGRQLADIAEECPESDLLDATESVTRLERRADATAVARLMAVLMVFAAVTGGVGILQIWQSHRRHAQEARLESVRALVDRTTNLEAARDRMVDSLRSFRSALRPSDAAGIVISRIAAKIPADSRLQVLAMEESGSGWRIRTEARLPDWSSIQPFSQAIRSVKGVSKVTVSNQSRQSDAVSAILDIEGVWP